MAVTLNHSDGPVLDGELVDISAGGVGTRHKDAKGIVPLIGEVWSDCHIALPDGHKVALQHSRSATSATRAAPGQVRIGSRFVDLDRIAAQEHRGIRRPPGARRPAQDAPHPQRIAGPSGRPIPDADPAGRAAKPSVLPRFPPRPPGSARRRGFSRPRGSPV
ncbi:MAG: hypothetical protein MZV65_52250 [Chromatiales bacterium]|nr:hypothetical protein [Chromatiales bacterium]